MQIDQPLEIKGQIIKNRICKSALTEQLGDIASGEPKPGLNTLYRRWAAGGIGLQITGNIMVDGRYKGEPANVVVEDERHMEALQAWAQAGQENGAKCWVQLNHPGKQTPRHVCAEPVSSSAIALGQGMDTIFNKPKAMSEALILETIERFGNSALVCKKAGFSGVQIHAAHGYLVSQFLSPRHNQRDDQWGGSLENRMRFLLGIYHAVREKVGNDFAVGVKLNSADFQRGGFTEEESMQVVQALAKAGIDLIEISGGNYESPAMMREKKVKQSTLEREAYFLEYAEKVRALVDVPLIVTGGFRSARAMREALASGALDMVGIGRPACVAPDFPQQVLSDENASCHYKYPTTGIGLIDKIAIMDINWHEHQLHLLAAGKPSNVNYSAWKIAWKAIKTILTGKPVRVRA